MHRPHPRSPSSAAPRTRAKRTARKSAPIASPPEARAVAAEIARALRRRRNARRAQGVQRFFKDTVVALGIDTPSLRAFARDRARQLRAHWTAARMADCAECLLAEPELEIRGTALLLLADQQRALTPDFLPRAESWLRRHLDNWALVDTFCGAILSPLLRREPDMERVLARWSRADSLWVRRAALVTLVPLARRGERLDLAYRLAAEHFPDPEDLIHKATGWLLRDAGKTDPDRLRRFLLDHGPAIPRTALRYAIERFEPAARANLLHATRKAGRAFVTPPETRRVSGRPRSRNA